MRGLGLAHFLLRSLSVFSFSLRWAKLTEIIIGVHGTVSLVLANKSMLHSVHKTLFICCGPSVTDQPHAFLSVWLGPRSRHPSACLPGSRQCDVLRPPAFA